MRCPVCDEPVDPGRRQVRSSVYVFCCDGCAPQVRHMFPDDRVRTAEQVPADRGPEAA